MSGQEQNMIYACRRDMPLLEVLISFTLVVFCALPLIYPQVMILKSEKEFLYLVQLDHAVNLLYAHCLEKLYRQEINWSSIEGQQSFPVDEQMLKASGITTAVPYSGTYAFIAGKQKPKNRTADTVRWINLVFTFTDKAGKEKEPLKYKYPLIIEYQPAS